MQTTSVDLGPNAHLIIGGIIMALGIFNILLGTVLKQWALKWMKFTFWFKGVNVDAPSPIFYLRTIGTGIILIGVALLIIFFGADAIKPAN